ncbi:aldehyde dehydrogenase [Streptomyces rapamycinicus]|uniref:Aldehyde dehydrogenase n=2 Tax=Streptomyces rapamycinicus TaxID=1226757 RepID=A0A3L8RCP9_STRRN|nr:aldehyde dehydrogenase [Streptomyces rapamycinicus]MBB4787032.1 acyl-CoA reductase-like NAD-dependent aldehyde dehydrogenase [Streptomyces rapamycinicus]RLV77519.1 aldehyde dehydrogenase [Streptomyces rapamycinicus NRRL 5491]UTO67031.1 aldehyde dehydrogenase [Streptomyces rapamycinicus]UTP34990.1 aldehyde dehydrogenase [Streptomyces rapamycinicus NRRL 5491]
MSLAVRAEAPIGRTDRFFIGGQWVVPSSGAVIDVIDSATEELYFRVAQAQAADMSRAVAAAREAFDEGPWPRLTAAERAGYLRAIGAELRLRGEDIAEIWPRESGVLHTFAANAGTGAEAAFKRYAALARTFPFEEPVKPTAGGQFGMIVREPAGVVGAIIPWNAPMGMISNKVGPALLAGCTVILKSAPEAPGEGYLLAEAAAAAGLPPGVINVVTADREVSELLVRDRRVDKITFTGSTATGRRIASICGERVARCTLELGGKSAAVVLDDMDLATAARSLAQAECFLTGQVCSSLTRIVVSGSRHDELVEALVGVFSRVRVGDPFDPRSQMGPLAAGRQRDRVEGYIAKGVAEGATLATGGGRPKGLTRGWYVEPTVFGNVDNRSVIAQEEIFGPVLSVIPAADEQDAIRIANDTIYGLNAAVFTNDVNRAREVSRQLRSGTVGHNALRSDLGIAFGGFKQSGIGREGGREGLLPYLETKTVILEGRPAGYEDTVL